MQFRVQCCMQEMSQLTYSYISMILDLYTRDVANDLCQKTSLRSVVIIDGGHWVRFIKSKILISNWENIKVYVVNLDVFLIGNQCFAFNEPGSGNSNNHNGKLKTTFGNSTNLWEPKKQTSKTLKLLGETESGSLKAKYWFPIEKTSRFM